MSFQGRYYVVTGAASGIGRETVIRLAQLGASGVAMSDVNEKGLAETKELCASYSIKLLLHRVDVASPGSVNNWIEEVYQEFGQIDGAANIAGLAGGDGTTIMETIVQDDWDRMIAVNLTGVMNCLRAELAKMRQPGGSVVNISSTSGLRGLPHNAGYASSKFGVIGLTESAAGEYGRKGVRINALLPGPIDTPIFRDGEKKGLFNSEIVSKATLLGRMGKPEEVAKVLCFLLSDDAAYVTGAHWTVDGGYAAC